MSLCKCSGLKDCEGNCTLVVGGRGSLRAKEKVQVRVTVDDMSTIVNANATTIVLEITDGWNLGSVGLADTDATGVDGGER